MRVGKLSISCAVGCSVAMALAAEAFAGGPLPRVDKQIVQGGFSQPLGFVQDPQDHRVQFVVQQRGVVRVLVDGQLQATPFIDLTGIVSVSGGERGLLGLAFPPSPDDDRFYVNYTANTNGESRIVRYSRDAGNPLVADPNSAEILLTVGQPFSNHNGGHLSFGPDGMLYCGFGDGGSGGDPGNRAQTPTTLLGKMIRIDVSPQTGYDIPADNPFVDDDPIDALEEIWAFGVRNPWRWSFDDPNLGGTGAMVMADVGQNAWEEVNYEPAGAGGRNYGWRNREGMHPFNNSLDPAYLPLTDPIHEYSHAVGQSITGGFVYRGRDLGSPYYGRYFFADFIAGRVWSAGLSIDGNGEATVTDVVEHTADLGGVGNVSSFGMDADGELYIVSYSGVVYKIIPETQTTLTSIATFFGTELSGGLPEVERSDDQRYRLRSQFGFSAIEPNIGIIEVVAETTADASVLLDVVLETVIDHPSGTGEVSLWNYRRDRWVSVGTYDVSSTEETHVISVTTSPDRFIEDGTGEITMRSKQVVVAVVSLNGFITGYDVVGIHALE